MDEENLDAIEREIFAGAKMVWSDSPTPVGNHRDLVRSGWITPHISGAPSSTLEE
jgi:hypothetical protein